MLQLCLLGLVIVTCRDAFSASGVGVLVPSRTTKHKLISFKIKSAIHLA